MGCRKLQLQDSFQLVENIPTKYRGARFIQDGSKKLTKWKYDQFGRLLKINDDGKIVTYEYSLKPALLAKQIINGIPV